MEALLQQTNSLGDCQSFNMNFVSKNLLQKIDTNLTNKKLHLNKYFTYLMATW